MNKNTDSNKKLWKLCGPFLVLLFFSTSAFSLELSFGVGGAKDPRFQNDYDLAFSGALNWGRKILNMVLPLIKWFQVNLS